MNDRIIGHAATRSRALRARLRWLVESAAMVLLVVLVALVLANSLSRYLLSAPLVWTEEVVKALLMWLGALGITVAALRGGLIACGIWTGKLPNRMRRHLAVFQNILGIGVMAVLAWLAWEYILLFGGDRSPILGLPKGIAISGIIGCAVGLSLAFLIDLIAPEHL
ncbi:TRAP transporter small permease [Pseudogemmobacter sonorensis]|uniref:TRAP transporter small permease n=1 Tax=Pseudogemmobacter sonorensis TaxID=2989681 RepID=UPI003698E1B4